MFSHCRLIWISLIACFALGLSACASSSTPEPTFTPQATLTPEPPTATPEPMALTVNGEGITIVDFNAEVQRYLTSQAGLGKTIALQDASNAVKADLTAQLLLAQAARTNGFTLDEAALQARLEALVAQVGGAEALSGWESAHGYTDQAFRSALKRQAESAWMRDKILAEVPSTAEQVHVQQILLYNQDQAQSFLMQLNGGTDFDELALKADPLTHGDLGWVPRGYLLEPKIEEAAFSLAVGEHSEVISTDAGFHIIRILAREPQRPLSPDAYLALQELALKKWIDEQRQQASITFAEQP
ncbi:MAG TPA: peptidyl-prolyl cis-trans isomerase [Anaerolineales bacterium]|nr:peptidyl-prolyl cis-trans isomerase [Anaerolineales bacterium]